MENYFYCKEKGGRIILKKNVIPRFFACQLDRNHAQPLKERAAVAKLRHIRAIKEIMATESTSTTDQEIAPMSSTAGDVSSLEESTPAPDPKRDSSQAVPQDTEPIDQAAESLSKKNNIDKVDKAVQVKQVKPKFRSVGLTCLLKPPAGINVALSPIKPETQTVATSPIKGLLRLKVYEKPVDNMISSSDSVTSEDFAPATTSSDTDIEKVAFEAIKSTVFLKYTLPMIRLDPKLFIGIPKNCYYIVDMLGKKLGVPEKHILLALKKIRLNEAYAILGYDFGLSASQVSRILANTIPNLANLLRQLIFWPSKESIQRNLPIQFRARFANVQSIIDYFEIEIEKPSDAVKQALTWSDYKKCNTLKYLIFATPDGLINYVSKGYGGRVSDVVLVEDCGYLELLPTGTSVLADRGFKHLETLLKNKNCTLVRPPSVESARKSTKEEVMLTKRIASVRIHIERVIRGLREFKSLEPHATVDNHLIKYTDSMVHIAASLINLQGPLIK